MTYFQRSKLLCGEQTNSNERVKMQENLLADFFPIMQVRDVCVSNQVGSDAGGKKWSNFGHIVKAEESLEFADGLDMKYEGI